MIFFRYLLIQMCTKVYCISKIFVALPANCGTIITENMRALPAKINVFTYMDYRKFLQDWYHAAKKSRAPISFREFSKRAGLKSTGYLKLVMEGARNLSPESLDQFIVALDLQKQEQDFFRNLVHYNQANASDEKNVHYQRLVRSRKFQELRPITREQYDYYADWYHPVVRELVVSHQFDGTPESIAAQIFPTITAAQVEKSIQLLHTLGFIEKTAKHRWKQSSSIVSTGAEVASHVVFSYQKNLLDLAKEVLEHLPTQERDVSTMTLGIVADRIPELKKMIQNFRRDVLKLVALDTNVDQVVQLNLQLFPLTKSAAAMRESAVT